MRIKKSGYKLGLISNIPVSWGSNFDERLFELKGNVKSNLNSNLTDFPWNDFELIILPNTVKDYKPNPNMFLKAYNASKKSNNIVYFHIIFKSIPVLLLLVIILFTASVRAKLSADIWFVKAGKA